MPQSPPSQALRLRDEDNVAIALRAVAANEIVAGVKITEPIPAGHKFALTAIGTGASVIKYAHEIAVARAPIGAGQHVHIHNVGMPAKLAPIRAVERRASAFAPGGKAERTFAAIRREDGQVATRNYVGVLTTVNCSATAARAIARAFEQRRLPEGCDGVIALTHGFGCAMAPESEGLTILRRTLAGYVRHPNFAGVLVLGLGCESNELAAVLAEAGGETARVRALDIQSLGGTSAAVAAGVAAVERLLERAAGVVREPAPLSHLSVGLQCGGSDAFSGITANPALGAAVDLLVAHGGQAILSETPEIYGAEHLLLARAQTAETAARLEGKIAWWRAHVAASNTTLNDNPSSGNIAGGISTILEKSLGAVAKGGRSPLCAVYDYAEPATARGLVFMDSPGFDPMSATGQVASGANLIAFTTGRGSTFGSKPAPSLKLATNTSIFERMRADMDVNCGDILDSGVGIDAKGREIFESMIALASGALSASERLGFGEAEFAPWCPGAIT